MMFPTCYRVARDPRAAGGRDHHEHICESLELFARGVVERDDERERGKHETLAPHVEPAMVRRQWLRALADDELPEVQAYGRPMSDGNWPAVVAAGGIPDPDARRRMNFDFSDDEKLVQRAARDFLADRSPLTRVRELLESDAVFDRRLWRAIGEMGWLGTAVPERHGGSGSGHLELVLIAEEMGRALAAVPFASSVLAMEAVGLAGSPDQQARLLPPLARGERIGTLVALEAIGRRGSYDTPPALQSGRLVGATLAAVDGAAADLGIVLAETDSGPALAVVDFHQAGVRRERLRSIDPTRSLALVSFDGAAAESLGPPGAGRETLARLLDRGAVLVAFEQLGGAQRCLEIAREYTMGRFAFGRPVASFQAIKHKLADMYVAVELARSNCYYGAWALATGGPELPTAAALARVSATEAFELCARESLQAHGGVGFTWEYDCHLFLKRSKLLASMLRPAFVWKDRLVELLEREAR